MSKEMQRKQRKILVAVQIAMVIIGLVLAVNDLKYVEAVADVVGDFVVLPVAFAGLVRFGVRAYQILSIKLGRKIYDEEGNCLTVSRPVLGAAAGIVCPVFLVGLVAMLNDISTVLLYGVAIGLLVVAVLLFVLDIRFLKLEK